MTKPLDRATVQRARDLIDDVAPTPAELAAIMDLPEAIVLDQLLKPCKCGRDGCYVARNPGQRPSHFAGCGYRTRLCVTYLDDEPELLAALAKLLPAMGPYAAAKELGQSVNRVRALAKRNRLRCKPPGRSPGEKPASPRRAALAEQLRALPAGIGYAGAAERLGIGTTTARDIAAAFGIDHLTTVAVPRGELVARIRELAADYSLSWSEIGRRLGCCADTASRHGREVRGAAVWTKATPGDGAQPLPRVPVVHGCRLADTLLAHGVPMPAQITRLRRPELGVSIPISIGHRRAA